MDKKDGNLWHQCFTVIVPFQHHRLEITEKTKKTAIGELSFQSVELLQFYGDLENSS